MPVLTIPTHTSELTPGWLTAVLRHRETLDRAAVTSVSSEVLGTGRGFTGQVLRLHLAYDRHEPTAPRSLIAKLPAADPAVRTALHELGLYAREICFYQDVATNATAPVPHCYYAALDPDVPAAVLLLEDLTPGQVGDNLAGCSEAEAILAVTQLARFHAHWWDQACLGEMAWLAPADHDGFARVFQQQWDPFRAKLAGRLPERLEVLGVRILDQLAGYHCWLNSPPTCIVHGDFRLDNLFFAGEGSRRPLTIFDWQVAVRGRGVSDVAYFAAFCLPIELRRRIERKLVRRYHETLVAGGVRGYSRERCWHDYRLATLNALVRLIGAGGLLDFSSERGELLAEALIERTDAILADHDAAALLDQSFPLSHASVTYEGAVR
jgi:hypothetical protein